MYSVWALKVIQVSCFTRLYLIFSSDDGWLHRAVDIDGEMHIIEELQLFDKPQPIESMVISSALVCIHVCRVIQNESLSSLLMLK